MQEAVERNVGVEEAETLALVWLYVWVSAYPEHAAGTADHSVSNSAGQSGSGRGDGAATISADIDSERRDGHSCGTDLRSRSHCCVTGAAWAWWEGGDVVGRRAGTVGRYICTIFLIYPANGHVLRDGTLPSIREWKICKGILCFLMFRIFLLYQCEAISADYEFIM